MPEPLNDKKIAQFREKICDIATRQFADRGIENVSMRSLARELGYSATALYSYYKNKEEILAAAKAAAVKRLCVTLQPAVQSSDDPTTQLMALARAYVDFVHREQSAYELLMMPAQSNQATYPDLDEAVALVQHTIVKCFENLARQNQVNEDPLVLAQAFWAAMHGAITMNLSGLLKLDETSFEYLYSYVTQSLTSETLDGIQREKLQKPKTNQQFAFDL